MTKIKICGISDVKTAQQAARYGANYIGLVFHAQSRRAVDLEQAKQISEISQQAGAQVVGVFVEQDAKEIQQIFNTAKLNVVQLHGLKSQQQLPKLSASIKKIFVISIDESGVWNSEVIASFKYLNPEQDFLLFDYKNPGSGKSPLLTPAFSEERFKSFPYFIAGGLNRDNVLQKIKTYSPFAVDVSSGVENALGQKDLQLIQQFIDRVKHERK